MANFDAAALALKAVCPNNDMLMDDKGLPSVMVYIPKFKLSDVITGASDAVHPAFIVNGTEVDGIYISKYQNIVNDSRAYSLPCEDPRASITFDQSVTYCNNKGDGWHCMTRAEWAAIALWCKKNNCQPKGNNNYGKDTSETSYIAIPTTKGSDGKANHVATGTGPLTWSHNGDFDGIWDLNGNVYEWQGGIRMVKGEIQFLVNNNAADGDNSQAAASAQWKALSASTGQFITPNGNGTTSGSVKADWVSNNHWEWKTTIANAIGEKSCGFASITCGSDISAAAKEVLQAYALVGDGGTDYGGDYTYFNNTADERAFFAGGYWFNGGTAGVFCLYGCNSRPSATPGVGFRSAFVKLPTA